MILAYFCESGGFIKKKKLKIKKQGFLFTFATN